MIGTKIYQLLTIKYVQQGAEDFERIYCETVDNAKMTAAWWIYDNSNTPYQLKWEERSKESHFAMIPHNDKHEQNSVGFLIRKHEIMVSAAQLNAPPGVISPAWVNAVHHYDYGVIKKQCPTCGNSNEELVVSSHQTSVDRFTHIVSQINTKCSECGARWKLYRDGSKEVA